MMINWIFPIIYTSAKQGISRQTPTGPSDDITPLLDLVIDKIPAHPGDPDGTFPNVGFPLLIMMIMLAGLPSAQLIVEA